MGRLCSWLHNPANNINDREFSITRIGAVLCSVRTDGRGPRSFPGAVSTLWARVHNGYGEGVSMRESDSRIPSQVSGTSSIMSDVKLVESRLWNYKQAAEYLNIGKSTLYALVSQGQLTCVRFGVGKTKKGVTRFRREDLERFVKARVCPAERPRG